MKRIIYLVVFFTVSLFAEAQNDTAKTTVDDIKETIALAKSENDSVQAAIVAYNEGDFYKSIGLLDREIQRKKKGGLESPLLYYNLGNAYFRVNEFGHARLNYERAALLAPGDRDIKHNVEYTVTRIEDKILEADTFFLGVWFNTVQNSFSADAWAVGGVILFLLFIGCLVSFFFTQQVLIKKMSFYMGLVAIIFVIFANIFGYRQKKKLEDRNTAIIMSGIAPVFSSPDTNSKELFILHTGTKVTISKDDRIWLEIEIDNGSVGWIQRDKIEII